MSTSNTAGFLTVDIHFQELFTKGPAFDESIRLSDSGEPTVAPRDGLAHIFNASEGQPVPNQLAALKVSFFVMETPQSFMSRVSRGASNFFLLLAWRLLEISPLIVTAIRRGAPGVILGTLRTTGA